MDAGHDSPGRGVHRVNEATAVIDWVDALRGRYFREVIGENRCLAPHQGNRLFRLLEREAFLGLCRQQPEGEKDG